MRGSERRASDEGFGGRCRAHRQPMRCQHGPRRRSPTVARALHSTVQHSSTTILICNTIPLHSIPKSCWSANIFALELLPLPDPPRLDKESSGTFDPSSLSCLNPSHRITAPRIRSLNNFFFSTSSQLPKRHSASSVPEGRRNQLRLLCQSTLRPIVSGNPSGRRSTKTHVLKIVFIHKLSIAVSKQPPCKHRTLTGIEQ